MKKVITIILCVLLISMLTVPVLAAQTATMSVSASKTTVNRGDTITVTISTSLVENCVSGGFMFDFDKTVFEYVSGSSLSGLSGYTAGVSTAAGNFAGYFMNGNATVQGSIFQITLKVKDSAAYGTYIITGTPSLTTADGGVSCGVSSTSVTVACKHNYGNWTDAGNGKHSHTCSICSNAESVNHTWNSGTITKAATCKEAGVRTYTCTACSATKTESIAKNTDHKYGNWTKANDTTHKHTCSVCTKVETANHAWNGTVTKAATCKETGVKTYICTACNATKTESIEKLTTHTYDHACDTDCNVCGVTRTTTHNYKTSWSSDKTNHWHECSACKDKKDVVAHIPGAEATEAKAQTCTTCGYVIKAALGHKHSYATTWTTDEAGHWYKCSGCEEKGSHAAHDFENDCDKDCSICGYTRETKHKFAEDWTTDANNHWHVCSGCGLKQDEAAHEPGAEATATTAQTCAICGYEIASALGVEETTKPNDGIEATTTAPVDQNDSNDNGCPVWTVIVVAIVAICGIATLVIIKKRKS